MPNGGLRRATVKMAGTKEIPCGLSGFRRGASIQALALRSPSQDIGVRDGRCDGADPRVRVSAVPRRLPAPRTVDGDGTARRPIPGSKVTYNGVQIGRVGTVDA